MIKGQGKWSTKLYQMLSSPDQIDRLTVSIEGPYGPCSTDFLRYTNLRQRSSTLVFSCMTSNIDAVF